MFYPLFQWNTIDPSRIIDSSLDQRSVVFFFLIRFLLNCLLSINLFLRQKRSLWKRINISTSLNFNFIYDEDCLWSFCLSPAEGRKLCFSRWTLQTWIVSRGCCNGGYITFTRLFFITLFLNFVFHCDDGRLYWVVTLALISYWVSFFLFLLGVIVDWSWFLHWWIRKKLEWKVSYGG